MQAIETVPAVRRFCRASKRAHDRALSILAGTGTLQADAVYQARQRAASSAWRALPSNLRATVRDPLEVQS